MSRPALPEKKLRHSLDIPHSPIAFAMERDGIEGVCDAAVLFEHCESFGMGGKLVANDEPYDDCENLYLVPN